MLKSQIQTILLFACGIEALPDIVRQASSLQHSKEYIIQPIHSLAATTFICIYFYRRQNSFKSSKTINPVMFIISISHMFIGI